MARKKMNCKQSIVKEVKDVLNYLADADKMSRDRKADNIDVVAQNEWKRVLDKAFSIVNEFAENMDIKIV